MAVDKSLTEIFPEDVLISEDIDIEFPEEEIMEALIIEEDDGSMTFDFDGGQEEVGEIPFAANLAEYVRRTLLSTLTTAHLGIAPPS
jgi:hypothetical protein